MMKKISIIFLLLSYILITTQTSYAINYRNFEDVNFVRPIRLIHQFTEEEYETYYKHVQKRKFYGWQTYLVHEDIKVKFISETAFVYHNDGKSVIDYHYKAKTKELRHYDISVSGSIGISSNKSDKTFKNGLTASLKMDFKYKNQVEIQEETELKIKIDPQTKLRYYYYGEGLITNGVAARYVLYFLREKGGFEVFRVTTHYPRLEVLPIWKKKK